MKKIFAVPLLALGLAGCQTTSTAYYNPYPRYVTPHPRYVTPAPVYVAPRPVYVRPPICQTYTRYNPYYGVYHTRRICH